MADEPVKFFSRAYKLVVLRRMLASVDDALARYRIESRKSRPGVAGKNPASKAKS